MRNPRAYLLRIASHVVAEWREQHVAADVLNVESYDELLVDNRTPEFELDARISQERLNEILVSCPPVMRAVLLLRLRDGRAYREIAQELGLTDRQVKRYLVRGYECLRRVLEC